MKTKRLFDNLAGGADNNSSEGSSSQNAIEKLNLLEEDDDADSSDLGDGTKTPIFDTDLLLSPKKLRQIEIHTED